MPVLMVQFCFSISVEVVNPEPLLVGIFLHAGFDGTVSCLNDFNLQRIKQGLFRSYFSLWLIRLPFLLDRIDENHL
jgi:hypothetical protein